MTTSSRQLAKRTALALAVIVCAIVTGAQDPQVPLRTTDGRAFDLASERSKVVVLSFGATWVPLTDKELPTFQRLADRYAGRGVSFYWVSVDSAKEKERRYISDADLQGFADELELLLPVLRDPARKAFRSFGLDALPAVVIIDREGRVFRKVVGFNPECYDPDKGEFLLNEAYGEVIRCLNQLLR
ncbi:MAG TPA: TlpA disulfide reductase family protein [Blastocatellia bacterium]|nr:TlpA disulfide reductase family protein [Blastocatellia bacterium]